MASKGMSLQMINMYIDLVEADFKGLERELSQGSNKIRDEVEKQVKQEWGIYELLAELEACKHRIEEIEDKTERYLKKTWVGKPEGGSSHESLLNAEVDRRMGQANLPLQKILDKKKELIREIKLSSVPAEVRMVFEQIPQLLLELKEDAKL